MRTHKLTGTDAFVVFDLDDAESAYGVTRLAPKILADGAQLLARTVTYAFAAFEIQRSGASAGINAKPDQRDEAVQAYVEELDPMVAAGQLVTDPGLGLAEADVAPLRRHDPRPPELLADGRITELTVAGAIAAAEAVLDGIEGRRVRVDGTGPVVKAAAAAATAAGATLTAGDDAEPDLLLVGGRPGSFDDEAAAIVTAKAVVPIAPVPVTAKAFAVASRAGAVYVPDFVSLAAPLLAGFDAGWR